MATLQLFEGVTTYPAIRTLRKGGDGSAGELSYLALKDALPDDLGRAFAAGREDHAARAARRAARGGLEGDALAALRDKIAGGRKTLGEVYGPPLRGIVTGLNEAFIIDTPTRDRLVKAEQKSAEILKPFLRGRTSSAGASSRRACGSSTRRRARSRLTTTQPSALG